MKLTRLSIGEEQIFLGAGDGLEHHLEVLHIVRQGTLRHFSVNVIIAMTYREYDTKFVGTFFLKRGFKILNVMKNCIFNYLDKIHKLYNKTKSFRSLHITISWKMEKF